ncbi:YggS family pyridoxal phosphate-dependent enzyme [Comamonas aquatica]|uniref:YggS family pyridoxal phosphate-dependent enzyme n=1 Tax=Comamonas aquatica TaxID=225991 RepID=UPI002448FA2A|nr:YggS family pyridoxal phosphate-dependent enzyme [Comamonas aquatica]MDH0199686.1 YggS family pyridoxal phosphate-dependent enzyme [Comamonas aquatica]MDH0382280.1 YggS family pyridoxal phosphate-dependent enzyme [Comamonas aquatica]MDH0428687.1 YggS family pyridoxal phosphate-dependent enzyme [Comamonas aquatica]MDH0939807.1 YggS family pyridoxal phosphate-dependent enzyme [Comamonas aquatica]MDH1444984.1 YggS family pyridoxal phosphate-dependent enzyme [Comamonas aquatica]
MTTIASKLQSVYAQISDACQKCGRQPTEVALLAVSKTFPAEAVREAALAGQRAFGENYIQEAVDKMAAVRAMADVPALQWHCIGPIQSNKTRLVAEHFDWAHTVDRDKIAQRLNDQRPDGLAPLQVCIQVNVDGGTSKSGCSPDEAVALARVIAGMPRLCLRGVMSIPDPQADDAAMLAVHRQVVAVFARIRDSVPGLAQWDTISLGMTADMHTAIAAGSTLVRVGSGIFGARDYRPQA